MSQYADAFIDDGYDEMDTVLRMNQERLLKIPGMKHGHAKKIAKAIAKDRCIVE